MPMTECCNVSFFIAQCVFLLLTTSHNVNSLFESIRNVIEGKNIIL